MKSRQNAKQKREAAVQKKRECWSPKKEIPAEAPGAPVPPKPVAVKEKGLPQQSAEEAAQEFLEYLKQHAEKTDGEET